MNKTGSKILHGMLLVTSALVGCNVIASTAALAGPTGGSVVVGHATITNPSATQTVVNQSSKKALINWDSFSIPADSTVKFNQPTSHSLTVNRVTGPNASAIDGQLLANGNVWLINANGIMFGRGSQVNVGALLATTSDLSDDDFRKNKYKFSPAQNPNAAVVNKGTIIAGKNSSVVLSAPRVSNEGLIQADLGTVVLGGAKAFTVDMKGDNLLRYQITAPVTNAPKDANGSVAGALVSNSGNIVANGGKVLMTARAARNIEDNVINNTGMVEATSVSSHNGEIDLDAGPDGTVNAGGTLDASGAAKGQTGGTINLTAGTVNVADGAKLNASGYAGGGTIRVGGGAHGNGPLAHAQNTIIGKATISADALNKGNGGSVTVWSDGDTSYAGSISAKGGKLGGNGGTVETSGHRVGVAISGTVNTTAKNGHTGNWILDPGFIDIVSSGPDSVGCTNFNCNISASSIVSALGTTNVMLEAADAGAGNSTITIHADIDYSSANTLSLLATGKIDIRADIQNSGTGNINLIAGWNGSESRLGHLTDSGVYGNSGANGAVVFNNTASIGSAGGITTVAASELDINQSANLYAQIGYNGVGGGDINALTTGNLNLTPQCSSIVQIGNGHTTGSIGGDITGDVSITVGGTSNLNSSNGTVVIGNRATAGHSETGNLTFLSGSLSDTGDVIGDTVSNDIVGGDVTIGAGNSSQVSGLSFTTSSSSGLSFNSTHNLTLLSTGSMSIDNSIQNSGNGSITLVGGWDGTTLAAASLTNTGVYGLNNDGVEIGGGGANGDVSVGTKNGKTIVAGYDVGVDGMFGNNAQLGYAGSGGGDITVDASHNLYLTGGEGGAGVVGNGDIFGETDGNVTGNISVTVGGTTTLTISAGEGGPGDNGWVFIGNGAAEGFKESGNVTVITGSVSNADSFNGENTLGAMLLDDLGTTSVSGSGGNVVFATTDPQTDFINAELGIGAINYNSPHSLTLLSTHDITLPYSIQNSGNGALTILAGWNPSVAPSAVLTTPGAYGNDTERTIFAGEGTETSGANIWVVGDPSGNLVDSNPGSSGGYSVGSSGTGTAIGSKGGTTTIGAAQIYVEGLNGYAQIGYHASGGTGAINVIANGAPGTGGLHGIQACFDGDANICVIGGRQGADHTNPTYAQIGDLGMGVVGTASANINISATGNVAVAGGGIYDDTQTDPMVANAYGMIGNGDASQSVNQTVGGKVSVNVAGQMNFASSDASNSIAWLGNRTGSGGVSSGALTLIMGSEDESGSMGLGDFIAYALGSTSVSGSGGNVIIAATDTANGDVKVNHGKIFSSSHDLTLLTAGSATFSGALENTGSGNITVVAGWNPNVSIANVLTTAGAYGNNGGSITIGGADATGGAAVGSAGGKTTILTDLLDVDAVHGYAQLGYHGTGGGNIVVNARGAISVTSEDAGQIAQIGNGGFGQSGTITGNIQLTGASVLVTDTADNAVAEIGNVGGNNASESGNIAINTTGAIAVLADNAGTSARGIAHIGNYTAGTTSGTTTGAITIHSGALSLIATGDNSFAEIGTGTYHGGTDNGAIAGNININATTLTMSAAASTSSDATAQARIGNLGNGVVTGNINITTTANISISSSGSSASSIGGVSSLVDSNQNQLQGQGSGNIVVQSGGAISLLAQNGGQARIESGGFTSGNVGVTASGDISLLVDSTSSSNEGTAMIGGLASGNSVVNVSVTSINGKIDLVADDADGTAIIGNVQNGASGALGGNVTIIAANATNGNITLDASGTDARAQIGNLGFNDTGVNGNVSVTAGNAASLTHGGLLGNDNQDGLIPGGAVSLTAKSLGVSGPSGIMGDSADIVLTGAGNGIGSAGNALLLVVNDLAIQTNNGNVFVSAPDNSVSVGVGSDGINLGTGNLTIAVNGTLSQTQAIVAGGLFATTTNGALTLANTGNVVASARLSTSGSDDASLYDSSDLTISGATVGGDLTLSSGGSIGQSGAITAHSLSVTTTSGAIALTNTGNAFDTASLSTSGSDDASLYDTSDLTIGGATVGGDLTLSSGGSVGQSGAIKATSLSVTTTSGAIALTNSGNAFDTASLSTSGSDDASLYDSSNLTISGAAIGGDLTLSGGGSIGQSAAITAHGLSVSTTSGAIELTNAGNAFGTASLSTSGSDDASLYDSSDLTIGGATVGGDLTLSSGGSIGQSGAISANALSVTANGAIVLNNTGNAFGTATLTTLASGDASLYDASDMTIAGAAVGGDLTLAGAGNIKQTGTIDAKSLDVSTTAGAINLADTGNAFGTLNLSATGSATVADSTDLTVSNVHVGGDLTFASGADLTFVKSIQLQNGSIAVTASGDINVGGAGAAGDVEIGSKTGTTALTADNVNLSAINGYAQVGYHGGGSGAVNVAASGDVTLTAGNTTGDFAQIGDGGYKVSGSNSAAVTVAAGGDVTLIGGSGQEAYAQIGNGGAESNSNSNGYTDTGLITVSGDHILLNAGSGDASYVQIGNGGYKSGQSLNGTATVGGNINVNAVNQVSVNGNGVDAYAQIGNGGGFVNSNAANGSGGTISGDVSVVVTPTHATTGDLITETAGGGDNAYVQIGNGGVFENTPVSGATVTFTVGGNVVLSDLKITGSNTGTDAYAQIGNGDAAKTGTGDVGGSVTLANGTTLTTVSGTAPGAGASLGNVTGHGTATGTVPKGSGIDSGTNGSVANTTQNPNAITKVNVTTVTVTPISTGPTSNNEQPSQTQEQTPLEQLANGGDEGTQASDGVADSVGNSLSGGKKNYVTSKTLIPGVLKQYVTLTPRSTHGVPPADEDYSSWGNEAFWRW